MESELTLGGTGKAGLLAGMLNEAVIPAQAGIQGFGGLPASMPCSTRVVVYWIPAFAGMTGSRK